MLASMTVTSKYPNQHWLGAYSTRVPLFRSVHYTEHLSCTLSTSDQTVYDHSCFTRSMANNSNWASRFFLKRKGKHLSIVVLSVSIPQTPDRLDSSVEERCILFACLLSTVKIKNGTPKILTTTVQK